MSEFYGKYRAVVSKIEDIMGCIRVTCPKIYGKSESPLCVPCTPFLGDKLPSVGDPVWIEFENGDPDYPIYTGRWLRKVENQPFVLSYKSGNLVISTKTGVLIELNSTSNTINITAPTLNLLGAVNITGGLQVTGSIYATGTIIDEQGNTNNHSHPS